MYYYIKYFLHDKIFSYLMPAKRYLISKNILTIYDWRNIKAVFIISTGRTGTAFLANFFNSHFSKTLAVHEPLPNIRMNSERFRKNRLKKNMAINILDFYRQGICKKLNRQGFEFYIEANYQLIYMIPVIRDFFPNYKIIFIVRNGIDYVRSAFSKEIKTTTSDRKKYIYGEHDRKDRIKATDCMDDPFYNKWPKMTRFEKVCWYWAKQNEILYNLTKNDSNTLFIKYEEIFNNINSLSGIMKIIEFIGIDKNFKSNEGTLKIFLNKKININDKYLLSANFTKWDENYKSSFTEICGKMMHQFKYWG